MLRLQSDLTTVTHQFWFLQKFKMKNTIRAIISWTDITDNVDQAEYVSKMCFALKISVF